MPRLRWSCCGRHSILIMLQFTNDLSRSRGHVAAEEGNGMQFTTARQQRPVAQRPDPDEARIRIHTPDDFEGMRKAGRLAAETLDFITPHVKPGVTTDALDRLCHGFILDHGGIPAPLNYRGFPRSICTSINHVVCHGIPGDRRLVEGDIVNIDVTPILDGWHGDSSRMYLVGEKIPLKA